MRKHNVNYEARFRNALRAIAMFHTPAQLKRRCEGEYGLEYVEALEFAYENMMAEAKYALKGYREPKVAAGGLRHA